MRGTTGATAQPSWTGEFHDTWIIIAGMRGLQDARTMGNWLRRRSPGDRQRVATVRKLEQWGFMFAARDWMQPANDTAAQAITDALHALLVARADALMAVRKARPSKRARGPSPARSKPTKRCAGLLTGLTVATASRNGANQEGSKNERALGGGHQPRARMPLRTHSAGMPRV